VGVELELPVAAREPPLARDVVDLLDGGGQAFPRMLEAIAQARESVYLEVYLFSPTGWGARFLDALAAAAARGVRVTVIVDGWGSMRGGREVVTRLRAAGCEARIYNRLLSLFVGRLRRDHRKILLVDDAVAFLGGINIGDEYAGDERARGWADLAVEIRGPASARLGRRLRHERVGPWDGPVHIYLSSESGGRKLRKRYVKAFAAAKRRLWVAHAYFLPDRGLIRALRRAARRGVDVRLLLAGRSDVPFAHAATMILYRRLLQAGVRIFEWSRSVLHVKAATVDGKRFLVGSFNLDPLSLANLEALVEIVDPSVVPPAERWIERHLGEARAIEWSDCSRSRWQRWCGDRLGLLAARVAQLLGRLLDGRRPRRLRS
jgi:cardiolipin synthase